MTEQPPLVEQPQESLGTISIPVVGITTVGEPISMNFQEFHALATLLQPFQDITAVFNSIRDRNLNEGNLIPYTEDALVPDTNKFTEEFQAFLDSKRKP